MILIFYSGAATFPIENAMRLHLHTYYCSKQEVQHLGILANQRHCNKVHHIQILAYQRPCYICCCPPYWIFANQSRVATILKFQPIRDQPTPCNALWALPLVNYNSQVHLRIIEVAESRGMLRKVKSHEKSLKLVKKSLLQLR